MMAPDSRRVLKLAEIAVKGEKEMPENPPGGSAEPPKTPPVVKLSIDQALAEKAALEKKVVEMQKTIDDLTTQLKAANDLLESQAKAKLISEILPRSIFTVEDLAKKNLEELQHIRVTLDQARLPTYKNIHFGAIGADEAQDEGLTVGDLSVVTAAKRKAGRP